MRHGPGLVRPRVWDGAGRFLQEYSSILCTESTVMNEYGAGVLAGQRLTEVGDVPSTENPPGLLYIVVNAALGSVVFVGVAFGQSTRCWQPFSFGIRILAAAWFVSPGCL